MNGRIYDPMIGRFLQADPIIQEPYNSQNYNRYAYVINNPLAHTDPSGYSFWTEVRRPVAAIIVTWLIGPGEWSFTGLTGGGAGGAFGSATLSSVAAGFAAGGVGGGNIESAITGAFTAGLLNGIGNAGLTGLEKIAAHALAGCVGAGINGGSCKSGAISGGFAAAAGGLMPKGWDNIATRALVGGAASRLSGGKFANGAFTCVFHAIVTDDFAEA